MSRDIKVICDHCGAVKAEPPDRPWWDFMYSSTDFPIDGGGSVFKHGSWDLCPDCSVLASTALVLAVGEPSSQSDSEPA